MFLDEIQAAPSVLSRLRYFYERIPQLHVICAGSLLDFALSEPTSSIPVGRIEFLYLGPMTFGEFLLARGQGELEDYLESYSQTRTIPEAIHILDVMESVGVLRIIRMEHDRKAKSAGAKLFFSDPVFYSVLKGNSDVVTR
ncbi:MAG: AAA family ATPase [Rectinema subterraneum]|uniref:AAA family ATPase n=1 Tax=Rectinema subterraneum TaxID=2653714 RepID=UPI003C7B19FE